MSPSLDVPPADFHEAVSRLRAYLRAHGRPEAIVWIKPEDVIAVNSRLHVRLDAPSRRWMDAQCRYELGLERKMGIILDQVCQAPGLSCCQVYIPKNAVEAGQRLNGPGLKLALSEDHRRANGVTSRIYWTLLKMRGKPVLA